MHRELVTPQLIHQLNHVLRICSPIIPVSCGWFVCCAEASKIWSNDLKVGGEEWYEAVLVIVCFWCSM